MQRRGFESIKARPDSWEIIFRNSSSFWETYRLVESDPKSMQCLKIAAVILVCSVLLTQTHCAALGPQSSELTRLKRMTPFWRGVTRPVGAPCREHSECFSRLCRSKRCSVTISEE
ncbi:liver-expressed antimicrobial peptide 2 [Paroedura picta]|uniref:liver-expressed antimicrobial peptide 2 n=1 Tax=Paroedura picta TaxID=143630 RepID=UPI0040564712